MPVIKLGPDVAVASGQCPIVAEFARHLPAASIGCLGFDAVYCRKVAESFGGILAILESSQAQVNSVGSARRDPKDMDRLILPRAAVGLVAF
jgi:hypothetical protein